MSIQIEEGKFYKRADGSVHGPAVLNSLDRRYPWTVGDETYTDDGRYLKSSPDDSWQLVAEAADPSAPVTDIHAIETVEGPQIADMPEWAKNVEAEAAEERTDAVIAAAVAATTAKHALPDNNPKTVFGRAKPPLHAIPPSALLHLGLAMENGEGKYGLFNWRDRDVSSSVYYDAALRHLMSWWDGEADAKDSRVHHLGHVMACCAIILDAEETGNLNDDRGPAGVFADVVERLRTARLKSA